MSNAIAPFDLPIRRRGLANLPIFRLFLVSALLPIMSCDSDDPPDASTTDAGPVAVDASIDPPDAETECQEESRRCEDDRQPQRCNESGRWVDVTACGPNEVCQDGECALPVICEPATSRCRDETTLEVCNDLGFAWEPTTCTGTCRETDGVAACDNVVCIPGERTCNGDQLAVECTADGTRYDVVERCRGERTGRQCDRGECVPLCILSEKVKTNVGCDYWAADLDNAFVRSADGFLDAAASQFAVVVSNPHPDFTAEVTVMTHQEAIEQAIVPPLGLNVFNLPRRDVDGTVLAPRAYRIRSSIPIVAYQFNPLENVDVFSNDASLLLPSHVLGRRYYVITREQSFERLRGYLTVIGISDEPTQVSVTVTALTRPGVGGIPALEPGETFEVVLNQFDTLNIESNAAGADLTGSLVEATQNVVVFGGSEAANVPNTNHCVEIDSVTATGVCEYKRDVPCESNYDCNDARLNTCCADHLEQQLFPVSTWGRHYVATKSFDRGLEADYWRIVAAYDNTKVETVPPQTAIPILNAGEWFEFGSREHFELMGDKPIEVAQFLASEHAPEPNLRGGLDEGDAGIGDPAFILAVPVEQFRTDFVFLAPDKYASDFVSIIAPSGAEVFFDELPVPERWEPVGTGEDWQIARFGIGDGVHFVQSDVPIAVIVYGYDQYVSYGYPGGLNLNVVDPESGQGDDEPPQP